MSAFQPHLFTPPAHIDRSDGTPTARPARLRPGFAGRVAALAAFVEAHDRLPSANAEQLDERSLSVWAQRHRRRYHREGLPTAQVAALEAIRLWGWDRWQLRAGELAAFTDEHSRLPSTGARAEDERALGRWVARQQACYAAGTLDRGQVGRLQATPCWRWQPVTRFERRALEVAAFRGEHGRFPSRKRPGERQLGEWLALQRKNYNTRRLSAERIAILDRVLGSTAQWRRGRTPRQVFARRVDELVAFVDAHQRLPSCGAQRATTERSLAWWVVDQRGRLQRGTMSADDRAVLERIAGWWWRPQASSDANRQLRLLSTRSAVAADTAAAATLIERET